MTAAPAFQAAQYRLARHFLNKLRLAGDAVQRGRAGLTYGLRLFDEDWPQIQRWQDWSAQGGTDQDERARLCIAFPFAGAAILALRQTPAERLNWWETALASARRIGDGQAERDILPKIATALSALGDLDAAEAITRQLLSLSEAASDRAATGRALYLIGTIQEDRGEFAPAVAFYERSLKLFAALGADQDAGRALLGLGSVAVYEGDHQRGYDYFLRYLHLAESGGREADISIALQAIGEALRNLKRYDEAETYLQRSVRLCRALNYQWALGQTLIALGVCAMAQDNLDAAGAWLAEGVEIARAFSARRDVIYGLCHLGNVRLRMGSPVEALPLLQQALEMASEADMPRYAGDVQSGLVHAYLALNDFDHARKSLHEALTIARSLGTQPQKVSALAGAVAVWHRLGQSEQAATWAGRIIGDPELDETLFRSVRAQLEAALGAEQYRRAIEQGSRLALDALVAGVLALLE